MCSRPKGGGSTKPLKIHYGGIMSALDPQTRIRFAQRANLAADQRVLNSEKAKPQKQTKQSKTSSLLSYFHLALKG